MGYYIRQPYTLTTTTTDEVIDETIVGAFEALEGASPDPLFDVTYNQDGTIPITVKHIIALQEGILRATSVSITPEEALDALFQYNAETLDDSL